VKDEIYNNAERPIGRFRNVGKILAEVNLDNIRIISALKYNRVELIM